MCTGCDYQSHDGKCDYERITGCKLPCKVGARCHFNPARLTNGTPRCHKWDTAKALRLYKKGMRDKDIAAKVGVTSHTIWAWRKNNGLSLTVPRSAPRPKEWEEQALELHSAGCNDREIAEVVGITRAGIFAWRKRRGLLSNMRKAPDAATSEAVQGE